MNYEDVDFFFLFDFFESGRIIRGGQSCHLLKLSKEVVVIATMRMDSFCFSYLDNIIE